MWLVGSGESALHAVRTAVNKVITVGIRLMSSPYGILLMGELHSAVYETPIVQLSSGFTDL